MKNYAGCMMVDNIVLFMMQLKGLGRKTIYKYFHLEPGVYSLGDVREIVGEAASVTGRVSVPDMWELEKAYESCKRITEQSREQGIRIISYLEEGFPVKLKKIDDPPAVIYTKGDTRCLDEKAVAVIGTREPIEYGAKIAKNLGYVLGRDGYTVVSGLAYGCDKYGHMGCLQANGRTVAVLAGGLDRIYPSQHEELAREIVRAKGCLLSEYPPGVKATPGSFVERDRLQSALSEGIIVVETTVRGGTWHTIEYAREYGRRIGCYRHPEKFSSEKQVQGNRKLLQEAGTIGIGNNDELYGYRKLIDQKHEELVRAEQYVIVTQPTFAGMVSGRREFER